MDKRYEVELLIVLLTYSMIAAKPTDSSQINLKKWLDKFGGNNINGTPLVKYAQLFNHGANSYVRIVNTTIDATTTNDTDPDTYLQIDMYGPTLMTIRSYTTGKYICHNPQTGYVEVKVISVVKNHPACRFIKVSNSKSFSLYRSEHNSKWFLAFHGRGKKKGRTRKAQSSSPNKRGSMYVQKDVKRPGAG